MRAIAGLMLLCCAAAQAGDIGLLGLFPNKAMLSVDGGAPKVYAVGSKLADGSRLVAVGDGNATIEDGGKRYVVTLGQAAPRSPAGRGADTVTLAPDARGHYIARGQINGVATPAMMIDTGASYIALPAGEARRMGVDYLKGRPVRINTANGVTQGYVVRLDTVRIGDVELSQCDAVVQESGLPIILLGNSFLNRFDMRRDGDQMTLTRRY
ncbi:MAG: TIGR02281 family clan AA aspartic protease [Pseudomonadota bacterium]